MKRFLPLAIFAIAMGILEAITVIYRRDAGLYAETGYMLFAEQIREVATITILGMIAIIASKNFHQWLAYFLFIFGLWDIFYYIGFKIFIDWPPSLLTIDVLFLIPLPWVAPVLAPLICSLVMIFLGISLVYLQGEHSFVKISLGSWGMLFGGAVIIFISFVWNAFWGDILADYNWWLFLLGITPIFWATASIWRG